MQRSSPVPKVALGAVLLAGLWSCSDADASARGGSGAPAARAAGTGQPIVVELFQSQGCSSCPPANAYLNQIASRADIVPLSFAVTYWDQLGWKDTFARPAFTQRQRDYQDVGIGQVATPEMIVDGKAVVLGANRAAFDKAIAAARLPAGGPAIVFEGAKVRVGAAKSAQRARVWLVRYDPGVRNVPVGAGENSGRTLPHKGIVRELVDLGAWNGAALEAALPKAKEAGLRTVVIVQTAPIGPMLAVKAAP